ncbi:MAG: Asparagine synthetase [glutamine-hydrolyzing] 1 [Candidatus Omnitrophica bacterium]|nr:Asparagine synthetase [glutamine-hydrolyzing] 1 [Candidatus Omnitrophota bacterium]
MCGIASIYNYHYAAPQIRREDLRVLREHLRHRGPDGEGEWYSDCGRVGLGHRRLSIIDLTDQGAQPCADELSRVVLVFNGEIYNHPELRRELELKGHRFRGRSDTEVLLRLYLEEGDRCWTRLRGMFAVVLWDARERCLKLVRDVHGIKPLYYADDGWRLCAASQVKALVGSRLVSHEKEPAGAAGYFLMGSVPEPFTLFREVRAVEPGQVLTVDERGARYSRRFGSVQGLWTDRPLESGAAPLAQAVRDSVRYHLVSDVPVMIYLSAGVDSRAIAALAVQEKSVSLSGLTLAFDEPGPEAPDESGAAAAFAERIGLAHRTHRLSGADFFASQSAFLDAMDQPTLDGANIYHISRAARLAGYKVALSGVGGDELFAGYPSFRDVPLWAKLLWLPSSIPGAGDVWRRVSPWVRRWLGRGSAKVDGLLSQPRGLTGAYLLKRGLFMPWELPDLLGKEMAVEGLRRLRLPERLSEALRRTGRSDRVRVACLEMCFYLRHQLLRDADWAGMAHGVEVRTPLVDTVLTAQVAALNASGPAPAKADLASAAGLSVDRPKSGFTLPVRRWIESDRALPECKEADRKLGRTQHWSRRWAYAVYRRSAR